MEFAWKDQNVVLFMSTISNGRKTVKRLRRRPAKTATNARTSRAVFGEMTTKELNIPEFINMYNHYMNGVDNADQLRCYYSTQRVHLKSWKPLWHFLLDSTIVNSYLLYHCISEQSKNQPRNHYSQREFRVKLASQLFEHSERLSGRSSSIKASLSLRVHPAGVYDHGRLEHMGDKIKTCVPCLHAGRTEPTKIIKPRKPLLELSINTVRPQGLDKRQRRQRAPRSYYGCKLCGMHICNHIACWNEHIAAIPSM